MLKAVIIEDEVRGITNLTNMLRQHCPDVQVIGIADSIEQGLKLLTPPAEQPDVAFLDIKLSDGLVFDLLDGLENRTFEIIFVSGYPQHGVKATWYNTSGFIMKPIVPEELKEVVNKVASKHQASNKPSPTNLLPDEKNGGPMDKIGFPAMDGMHFRNRNEVIRFEGDDNYTKVFFSDKNQITISKTIKVYHDLLTDSNFFRVHKRHLVNIDHVVKHSRSDDTIRLSDGSEVPLSRRRKPEFIKFMSKFRGDS